jgi:hypothetical protein
MVMGTCEAGHAERLPAKPYCVSILSHQPAARAGAGPGVRGGKQGRVHERSYEIFDIGARGDTRDRERLD